MQQGLYQFSNGLFTDFPSTRTNLSSGTKNKIVNNSIEKFSGVFSDEHNLTDIEMYCRFNNQRTIKFIDRNYVKTNQFIDTFNVLISEANSSDNFGTPILTPFISGPGYAHTDTFLTIGSFATRNEAIACMKYIMTKFVRVLLGVAKVTQHTSRKTWRLFLYKILRLILISIGLKRFVKSIRNSTRNTN